MQLDSSYVRITVKAVGEGCKRVVAGDVAIVTPREYAKLDGQWLICSESEILAVDDGIDLPSIPGSRIATVDGSGG
jgi:hypothetical protein